jgi:hypothetical protein
MFSISFIHQNGFKYTILKLFCRFVAQLRAETYSGPSAVLGFLKELILQSGDDTTADQDECAHKDAQVLWER